jgi:hypothetical protein
MRLAPVYGWFTEDFDRLDLKEAKSLLSILVSTTAFVPGFATPFAFFLQRASRI